MSNSSLGFSPVICTNPPSGIGAIWKIVPPRLKLDQRRTETDREPLDAHPAQTRHQEVATLVQHDQEREPEYREGTTVSGDIRWSG